MMMIIIIAIMIITVVRYKCSLRPNRCISGLLTQLHIKHVKNDESCSFNYSCLLRSSGINVAKSMWYRTKVLRRVCGQTS